MMVRKKLAAAVAVFGALQSGLVSALGLGELRLESALNQPLNAEVKLLDTRELDESQIIVRLASQEDFKRAGVSRDFFLTNIKFDVDVGEGGLGKIRLTTTDPVVEPYLNFLIETRWPTGRLLREYTVLLDLPVFSEASSQPQVTTAPVVETVRQQPRPATPSSSRQTLSGGSLEAGNEYRVRQNDTLWEIAAQARPSSDVTVQQTMVAIQQLNPSAFLRGNINAVKAGYVLRLPTENQIIRTNSNAAAEEVALQNKAWRSGESLAERAPQLDATAAPVSQESAEQAGSRLSIATSGDAVSAGSDGEGEGSPGGSQALRQELSVAEEQLAASERANEEMSSRLEDMEVKMATLQRLLELKEDQLAALQGELSKEPAQADAVQADTPVTPDSASAPQADVTEPKPAPAPQTAAAQPESASGIVDVLKQPMVMAGGGAILLLALLAAALKRRRKDDDAEAAPAVNEDDQDDVSAELADVSLDAAMGEQDVEAEDELSVGDFAADTETFEEPVEVVAESDSPVESPAAVQSETGDAIAEAEIYVAYGRYQQAIDLLTSAVAQEPARSELYVKLLEVCIETRDKPSFQQHFKALQGLGDTAAIGQVKELLSSVDGVSDWLDDLGDFGTASAQAESLLEAESDEPEIDLSDDFAELELDLEPDMAADTAGDTGEFSFDLDMDLDAEDLDAIAGSETAELDVAELEAGLAAAETLDFDLQAAEDAELDQERAEDFSLDLDLAPEDVTTDADLADSLDGDLELDLSDLDADIDGMELSADLDDLDLDAAADSEGTFAAETSAELEGEQSDDLTADFDNELDLGVEHSDGQTPLSEDIDLGVEAPSAQADVLSELSDNELDDAEYSLGSDNDVAELDGELDLSADLELGGEDFSSDLDLGEDFGSDFELTEDLELASSDDTELGDITASATELSEDGFDAELDLSADLSDLALDTELAGADDDLSALDESFDLVESEEGAGELADVAQDLTDAAGLSLVDEAVELNEPDTSAEPVPVADSAQDDDFDFLADTDEVATKLDLARAYIDMGDAEGARDILDEVMQEGNEAQQQEAGSLLESIE